jgi:7-carboxy-7-deazaguanine synthase
LKTVVSQIIKTIQGEGPSIGFPVTLIRFASCNLACSYCDTKWALKIPKCKPFDGIENNITPYEINYENVYEFLMFLKDIVGSSNRILFTGGEPFLHTKLMDEVTSYLRNKYFEIETNGLLLNDVKNREFLERRIDRIQLNVSPKFDEYSHKYTNEFTKSIEIINETIDVKVIFKFVYRQDQEKNLIKFIEKRIPKNSEIVFSPMTPPLDIQNFESKFKKSCLETVDFCIRNDFRYSPREHVNLFGADRDENL